MILNALRIGCVSVAILTHDCFCNAQPNTCSTRASKALLCSRQAGHALTEPGPSAAHEESNCSVHVRQVCDVLQEIP